MKAPILILSVLIGSGCLAQEKKESDSRVYTKYQEVPRSISVDDSTKQDTIKRPGKITINEDVRITELVKRYNSMNHVQKGFRVQIYLGSRTGQSKARSKFMSRYPDYHTYLDYQAPNFKVRVGDFKKRTDAERLLYMLRTEFPGAYIVPDEVNLNRIP